MAQTPNMFQAKFKKSLGKLGQSNFKVSECLLLPVKQFSFRLQLHPVKVQALCLIMHLSMLMFQCAGVRYSSAAAVADSDL